MIHHILADMFSFNTPVLEKIIRPILVYVFLILLLRIFGKRELAQLNPFDLVVLLSLSNTVQNAIIGDDNSVGGAFIGAFALVFCNYVVVRFLFRHRRLDQILEGKPSVLVKDGKLCKDQMAKELITTSELQSVARRQGFEGIHEVQDCILEPGGAFVMRRKCPSNEDVKHQDLLTRLDAMSRQLQQLQEKGSVMSEIPVLTVAGLWNSGPLHWQTSWEAKHPTWKRVAQRDWDHPDRDEWVDTLDRAIRTCATPPVLAAHSLGCALVAEWSKRTGGNGVRGALLVAPSDVEAPSYPREGSSFDRIALDPLPFPSIVVASTNDEYITLERAQLFADAWGSRLLIIGAAGHINGAAGYGPWPEGEAILLDFLRELE